MNSSDLEEDCAVCGKAKEAKIKVPDCTHTFCFKCIKGVLLNADERGVQPACPMCRTAFSGEFLTKHRAQISKYSFGDNPGAAEDEEVLEEKPDVQQLQAQMRAGGWDGVIAPNTPSTSQPQRPVDQAVYWLYGGAGGWWKYGESDRVLLEEKYLAGEPSADTWVMGFKYTIDFARMVQYRADDHYKMRAVKRCNREELRGTIVKGEAGILFAEIPLNASLPLPVEFLRALSSGSSPFLSLLPTTLPCPPLLLLSARSVPFLSPRTPLLVSSTGFSCLLFKSQEVILHGSRRLCF